MIVHLDPAFRNRFPTQQKECRWETPARLSVRFGLRPYLVRVICHGADVRRRWHRGPRVDRTDFGRKAVG